MATDKNTLKSWFKTGLKPTQLQFWAWMDSYFHKDEAIPQNSISGLQQVLNAKAEKTQLEAHLSDPDAHSELLSGTEKKENKGIAGGYAPLDEFSKIAHQYLSIVNNLTSGGASAMLSAEQGVVLQNQINSINALLSSDNVNLDTFQEIVDEIEKIQNQINNISVNDATNAVKGIIKLSGDLSGTADAPTVTGLANKLTATLATDAETQLTTAVTEDNKVVSRLKLFNWWVWQKTRAQVFGSSVQAQSFNTGSYITLSFYSADFTASATKRITIDAANARIVGQNGATTTLIYFDPTPTTNNIYVPNATGRVLLDSTLKDVYLNNFQKTTFSPMYLRVNNSGSDVVEDLRINLASGNNRTFFERCIAGGASKGAGTWERTVSTVKINNTAVIQAGIGANTAIDFSLSGTSFTWEIDSQASKTDSSVLELISANKLKDVDDKTTNFFRVTVEFSYAAGGSDGTVDLAIVNPANVVIDQESESINVDAAGATSKISVFRLFAVKTSDNNVGYTLRMTVGAKALTGWRIKSILRTNN